MHVKLSVSAITVIIIIFSAKSRPKPNIGIHVRNSGATKP